MTVIEDAPAAVAEHRAALAERYLVGGVTSGWNAFQESGPAVLARAEGCHVWYEDGRRAIDWIMGWGSLLLGHDPAPVLEAVRASFQVGFGVQFESADHAELARAICERVPSAEKVRLASSGSEATLHALRVARRVTGRTHVVKFEGHFHGLNDYLLYGVDSAPVLGALGADGTVGHVPGSAGLPDDALAPLVSVLPFNDLDAAERLFRARGGEIAAVILEPIALNIGCVAPDPGFLQALRALCDRHGALLVFDEVLTGFRVAAGGAQALFGVMPDLTCLGKALGCGMPVAALAGRREHMEVLAPRGEVQMAGTNTGRRMTVMGTLAAVRALGEPGVYERLRGANDRVVAGVREVFARRGVPAYVEGYGGRIGIHLGSELRPRDFREVVARWNRPYHVTLYRALLERDLFGFLLPLGICPEPVTLSLLHDDGIIGQTLDRLDDAVRAHPYGEGSA